MVLVSVLIIMLMRCRRKLTLVWFIKSLAYSKVSFIIHVVLFKGAEPMHAIEDL